MKKIIGIASLIIALILGTCLSSQAQIVMVQPMQIDGGFNSYLNILDNGNKNNKHIDNVSDSNFDTDANQVKNKPGDLIVDYESLYKICTYKENKETGLHSGSYYRKVVSCNPNSNKALKKSN